MELRSLQSPSLPSIAFPLTSSHSFPDKPFVGCQVLKLPISKRYPHARKCRHYSFRAQAAGTTKFSSAAVETTEEKANMKNENVVFVAGATGKVGSRTVRELLKLGFQVRAGVRSAQKAETLVQSVRQMKLNIEDESPAVEKLEIIECDLEKRDQIAPALGNASVVICCIGASEKEVFDITGPYRIDYVATKNLIEAATVTKVNHFIMVSSLGTNKVGFPAAILNLFWGVLCWKRKAEEALIASGLPYTIVRPGGMERPTDAYKETHNITFSQEDTLFGGQVSNLQVAELMAVMARNFELSYCKVVEVIAETTAPLTPIEELLAKIPSQRPLPKVPDASGMVDLKASKTGLSTAPSTRSEKDATDAKPTGASSPRATTVSDVDAMPAVPEPASPPESDPASTSSEKEALYSRAKKSEPLSPFTVYDDLKPPTSPTPTPPRGREEKVIGDVASELETSVTKTILEPGTYVPKTISETKKAAARHMTRPLSPYVVYEDLKPPSSPSPTPSGPRDEPSSASTPIEAMSSSIGGNDASQIVDSEVIEETPPQKLDSHRSPYNVYDDLKPPASPSPNAPNGSPPLKSSSDGAVQATLSDNSTAQSPLEDKSTDKLQQQKPRPLSPYTMYEDLKPPSSPSPSPKKFS